MPPRGQTTPTAASKTQFDVWLLQWALALESKMHLRDFKAAAPQGLSSRILADSWNIHWPIALQIGVIAIFISRVAQRRWGKARDSTTEVVAWMAGLVATTFSASIAPKPYAQHWPPAELRRTRRKTRIRLVESP